MLREDLLIRKIWAVAAGLVVIYGVVFTATRVNFNVFDSELKLRGASHRSLVDLLDQPAVRDAQRCGPVTVPSHKLVPDARWILGADADEVLARADPASERQAQKGVSVFVVNRAALLRQALVATTDDVFDNIPLSGFHRLAFTPYYSAYVRC
jgi:hypothetical protein